MCACMKTEWILRENLLKRSHSRYGVDRLVCYDRATEKTVIDLIGEDQQGFFRNKGPMQILRQWGDGCGNCEKITFVKQWD